TTGFSVPTLSLTGALPSGLTFAPLSGIISGTPTSNGHYSVSIVASNGVGGSVVQNLAITVNQPTAITSADKATFVVGSANNFTVTMTGFPTPIVPLSGNVPAGLTVDPPTGQLSATPTAASDGVYTFTVTAHNGIGTDATQSFTLTIGQPPAFTSPSSAT